MGPGKELGGTALHTFSGSGRGLAFSRPRGPFWADSSLPAERAAGNDNGQALGSRLPRGGDRRHGRPSCARSAVCAVLTPRTHTANPLSGISLNWVFWYNLFPDISSTLVHYHLGNCLFSIILTIASSQA